MHNILTKLLQKRGIESVNELDKDEKQDFESWQAVLNKDELTVEDIKKFCQGQVDVVSNKWADHNIDNDKKAQLIPYFVCYTTLLKAINSPKLARDSLEKNLNQLIQ